MGTSENKIEKQTEEIRRRGVSGPLKRSRMPKEMHALRFVKGMS